MQTNYHNWKLYIENIPLFQAYSKKIGINASQKAEYLQHNTTFDGQVRHGDLWQYSIRYNQEDEMGIFKADKNQRQQMFENLSTHSEEHEEGNCLLI